MASSGQLERADVRYRHAGPKSAAVDLSQPNSEGRLTGQRNRRSRATLACPTEALPEAIQQRLERDWNPSREHRLLSGKRSGAASMGRGAGRRNSPVSQARNQCGAGRLALAAAESMHAQPRVYSDSAQGRDRAVYVNRGAYPWRCLYLHRRCAPDGQAPTGLRWFAARHSG